MKTLFWRIGVYVKATWKRFTAKKHYVVEIPDTDRAADVDKPHKARAITNTTAKKRYNGALVKARRKMAKASRRRNRAA